MVWGIEIILCGMGMMGDRDYSMGNDGDGLGCKWDIFTIQDLQQYQHYYVISQKDVIKVWRIKKKTISEFYVF